MHSCVAEALLRVVDAGLVVLVLGVEARAQVVQQRGRRHEPAHHLVAARQQHPRARRPAHRPARRRPARRRPARRAGARRRASRIRWRRGRRGPLAPLRYLALDVQRATLRAATPRAFQLYTFPEARYR